MKKFILLVLFILIPVVCFGAATETRSGNRVVLTAIDADWTASSVYHKVNQIVFIPGAADDIVAIEDGAGSPIITLFSDLGETMVFSPMGDTMTPMIDFSDCTLSSGHAVIFYLD